jgi:hypothetical protein
MPGPEAPILDYASPRKRSRFRLASSSLLAHGWEGDGGDRYRVREWLAQQEQAKLAIALAVVILIISGFLVAAEWRRSSAYTLAFVLIPDVLTLVLIPLVIQQSWRETHLVLFDGVARLTMGGRLARRSFSWPFADVHAVRVIVTQTGDGITPALGEIEILAANTPPVRLFTDHPEYLLARIGAEIDCALRGESPTTPPPLPPDQDGA